MIEDVGLAIEEVTYIIADFYPTDEFGNKSPNLSTFISGFNFLIMTVSRFLAQISESLSFSVLLPFNNLCLRLQMLLRNDTCHRARP